jgi:hypothetical protein
MLRQLSCRNFSKIVLLIKAMRCFKDSCRTQVDRFHLPAPGPVEQGHQQLLSYAGFFAPLLLLYEHFLQGPISISNIDQCNAADHFLIF